MLNGLLQFHYRILDQGVHHDGIPFPEDENSTHTKTWPKNQQKKQNMGLYRIEFSTLETHINWLNFPCSYCWRACKCQAVGRTPRRILPLSSPWWSPPWHVVLHRCARILTPKIKQTIIENDKFEGLHHHAIQIQILKATASNIPKPRPLTASLQILSLDVRLSNQLWWLSRVW